MLSVENIFGAEHDVWAVNVEAEYHEQTSDDEPSGTTSRDGEGANGRDVNGATGRDAPVLPRRALDAAARAAEPKADAGGR
jgi:hypothetical protein